MAFPPENGEGDNTASGGNAADESNDPVHHRNHHLVRSCGGAHDRCRSDRRGYHAPEPRNELPPFHFPFHSITLQRDRVTNAGPVTRRDLRHGAMIQMGHDNCTNLTNQFSQHIQGRLIVP